MPKISNNLILLGLLVLMPVLTSAQTCQTNSIPATTPDSRFQINPDGTATDQKTGLVWKRCSEGQTLSEGACTGTASVLTWQEALQQAQTVNSLDGFAGFNNWRVPNRNELASIVERQCVHPSINLTVFPDEDDAHYWSSSPLANRPERASIVFSNFGQIYHSDKGSHLRVRLVRSGE